MLCQPLDRLVYLLVSSEVKCWLLRYPRYPRYPHAGQMSEEPRWAMHPVRYIVGELLSRRRATSLISMLLGGLMAAHVVLGLDLEEGTSLSSTAQLEQMEEQAEAEEVYEQKCLWVQGLAGGLAL